MSIPEEMISKHINGLLGNSNAGDSAHTLYIVAAPAGADVGPFGLVDDSKLEMTVAMLAYEKTPEMTMGQFMTGAFLRIRADHKSAGKTILFAGLALETWWAESDDPSIMAHRGSIADHPDAAEVTMVYAACRDGRRWSARRYLTGPRAGESVDPTILVGRLNPREGYGMPVELVWQLVDLR